MSLMKYGQDMNGAYDEAAAIVPADGSDLPALTRAIYVGVTGDVKVDLETTGTGITFKAMPVGIHRIRAKRVYATGTTATNLVALY